MTRLAKVIAKDAAYLHVEMFQRTTSFTREELVTVAQYGIMALNQIDWRQMEDPDGKIEDSARHHLSELRKIVDKLATSHGPIFDNFMQDKDVK